jgi:dipeptidyl-peptidase-4
VRIVNIHAARLMFFVAGVAASVALGQVPGQPTGTPTTRDEAALRGEHDGLVSDADRQSLIDLSQTRRFSRGTPGGISLSKDGRVAYFLRSGPRSPAQELLALDVASGAESVIFPATGIAGGEEKLTAAELARRERTRSTARGVASYSISDDGSTMLVPFSDELWIARVAGEGRLAPKFEMVMPKPSGFPIDATLSPDGSMIAAVVDGDVMVAPVSTDANTPNTWTRVTPGASGSVNFGEAEFVAQEEMGRTRGYWWAPDSSAIAFQRTDTKGMEVFGIADAFDPAKPPTTWPYPRAGKANAEVSLHIVPIPAPARTPASVWKPGTIIDVGGWDRVAFPYLATVRWSMNAPLTILVQNRAQTEQVLLEVDPARGSTKELLREKDAAWLNLDQECPLWLSDGSGFLWTSERSGEWMLELRARDGTLRHEVSPQGFGFTELVGITGEGDKARVIVHAEGDPTILHVWSMPIEKPEYPVRLTEGMGMQRAVIARTGTGPGTAWVRSRAMVDGTRDWTVMDGITTDQPRPVRALVSKAEEPAELPNAEYVKLDRDQLSGVIVRPRSFVKGRKYPVVLQVYGGPGVLSVDQNVRTLLDEQWIANQGFIVVSVDGRGTPRRGRGWERSIKGDVISGPLDDQVRGLRRLSEHAPEMDMSRVAIRGWSFGGYFAAMGAMRKPEVFKAGVAGAPVADWRDYDTHYTERYMGLLPEAEKAYDQTSVLTYAKDLRVPLLIIHGSADDNVYPVNSLKMADALLRSGKHFEFVPLAGATHMVSDPDLSAAIELRVIAFLKRSLE